MVSRALRLTCGALAFIAIGAAAFLLFQSQQQVSERAAALRTFDQRAHDATSALVDARVGQEAYVAAGQGVAFWFGKTAASIQAAAAAVAALRELAGAGARTALDEASATLAEFTLVDNRVRDYLKTGQQLMAGDVIFTEGGDAAATAVRQIEAARQAQHQAGEVEEAATRQQQMLTAGGATAVVALILLLLLPLPRSRPGGATPAGVAIEPPAISGPASTLASVPAPVAAPAAPAPTGQQAPSLKALTLVATDFGRVRDLEDLTRVLGRAADVMDATGLIVWVGGPTGSDLRPVLAHGYSAEMIARIPPVPSGANNAAAAAYRSGTLQVVPLRAGGASSGAVVAPILSSNGCVGALTAEIRDGGEKSEHIQAIAAIFASYLAGVLPTTPAALTEPRTAAQG